MEGKKGRGKGNREKRTRLTRLVQDRNVVHYDGHSDDSHSGSRQDLKKEDDVAKSEAEGHIPLVQKLEKMSM